MSNSDKAQHIIHDKFSESEYETNKGKFASVNTETGEFFISDDDGEAIDKSLEKYPPMSCVLIKIGYQAAFVVGGGHNSLINF